MTRVLAALTSSLVGVLVLAGCAATSSGDTSGGPAGTTSVQPWQQTATPTSEPPTPAPSSATEPPTPAPTTVPTPEVDAAESVTITGTGYTYNAPEGWVLPLQATPGFDPDSMVLDLSGSDSFADNVNVIFTRGGEFTPAEMEPAGVKGLKMEGATHVVVNRRVSLAGSQAAHLSARMSERTIDYVVDQFYVGHGGINYCVSFSFSSSFAKRDRRDLTREVLASWTWTD